MPTMYNNWFDHFVAVTQTVFLGVSICYTFFRNGMLRESQLSTRNMVKGVTEEFWKMVNDSVYDQALQFKSKIGGGGVHSRPKCGPSLKFLSCGCVIWYTLHTYISSILFYEAVQLFFWLCSSTLQSGGGVEESVPRGQDIR